MAMGVFVQDYGTPVMAQMVADGHAIDVQAGNASLAALAEIEDIAGSYSMHGRVLTPDGRLSLLKTLLANSSQPVIQTLDVEALHLWLEPCFVA